MTYYIRFIEQGELKTGLCYALDDEALNEHILGFLENYPGEFYDVVVED